MESPLSVAVKVLPDPCHRAQCKRSRLDNSLPCPYGDSRVFSLSCDMNIKKAILITSFISFSELRTTFVSGKLTRD